MKNNYALMNTVVTILEYVIVILLLYFVVFKSFVGVVIVMVPLSLIMLYLGYSAKRTNVFSSLMSKEEEVDEVFEDFLPDIEEASKLKGKEIPYHIVEIPNLFSSAFESKGEIYLNKSYQVNKMFLKGVIDHELGHVISEFEGNIYAVYLRPSTLLSGIFHFIGNFCYRHKVLKIFVYPLFALYYVINIVNRYVLFSYMKKEEFIANSYEIKLGGGDSLRAHYYKHMQHSNDTLHLFDFAHPKISEMIEAMNAEMGYTKEYELDVYAIDDQIKFIASTDKKQVNRLRHLWLLHKSDRANGANAYKIGLNYQKGTGIEKDIDEALKWLHKSIELNYTKAYQVLGKQYEDLERFEEAYQIYYEGFLQHSRYCRNKVLCKFDPKPDERG